MPFCVVCHLSCLPSHRSPVTYTNSHNKINTQPWQIYGKSVTLPAQGSPPSQYRCWYPPASPRIHYKLGQVTTYTEEKIDLQLSSPGEPGEDTGGEAAEEDTITEVRVGDSGVEAIQSIGWKAGETGRLARVEPGGQEEGQAADGARHPGEVLGATAAVSLKIMILGIKPTY